LYIWLQNFEQMKKIFFLLFLSLFAFQTNAQSKVGSIDIDFIIAKMPDLKSVKDSLAAFGHKLDEQLNKKMESYRTKLQTYNEAIDAQSMTEEQMVERQNEIFALEDEIQKFRQNGITMIQLREDELKRPMYSKIAVALEKIATENKYTQVISTDSGLVFIDPEYDLTIPVMKQMGLPVED